MNPVDPADLASAAAAATPTIDPDARLELVTAGPVPATGDRDALLRAVRNLLDNALAVADTVVVEVTQSANGPTKGRARPQFEQTSAVLTIPPPLDVFGAPPSAGLAAARLWPVDPGEHQRFRGSF